ncbi:TRAP transporter large permease [Orrella marina]|uniref:TRAP transporter large permease protein n=1 Tax=Orrella marina TaxID=2163011 RepID=A0A2R4XM35_9BURK|nr:TRAP transporter large permease [Orrella marina]AWB34867.1 TRAP transporter large permease [Orrella marina]
MELATGLVILFLFLIIGFPVALSMALAGAVGIWLIGGDVTLLSILRTSPMSSVNNYEIVTIPLFILMAEFIIISGVAKDLFTSASVWVGKVRGGLAMATALAGAGFAAISGSSTAAAATLASTSLPAMIDAGYDPKVAAGTVAISGTLAMLIPPSIALIIYGIIADVPVGKLLIGGVIPGILVTLAIMTTILVIVTKDPSLAPTGRRYTIMEKIRSLRNTGPMILLLFAVTGLIYTGIATPTESAGIGAFVACLIAAWKRQLSFQGTWKALINTGHTTCMILFIMLGAQLFGYFLTLSQATVELVNWIDTLPLPPLAIMAIILVGYIILGFFLDQVAILILTVPVLLPVIINLGFDPVWFGVIVVVTAEVGMVTPPMGMNVFIVKKYTDRSLVEIFQGVIPHIYAHIVVITLLTIFPALVLWLPNSMR